MYHFEQFLRELLAGHIVLDRLLEAQTLRFRLDKQQGITFFDPSYHIGMKISDALWGHFDRCLRDDSHIQLDRLISSDDQHYVLYTRPLQPLVLNDKLELLVSTMLRSPLNILVVARDEVSKQVALEVLNQHLKSMYTLDQSRFPQRVIINPPYSWHTLSEREYPYLVFSKNDSPQSALRHLSGQSDFLAQSTGIDLIWHQVGNQLPVLLELNNHSCMELNKGADLSISGEMWLKSYEYYQKPSFSLDDLIHIEKQGPIQEQSSPVLDTIQITTSQIADPSPQPEIHRGFIRSDTVLHDSYFEESSEDQVIENSEYAKLGSEEQESVVEQEIQTFIAKEDDLDASQFTSFSEINQYSQTEIEDQPIENLNQQELSPLNLRIKASILLEESFDAAEITDFHDEASAMRQGDEDEDEDEDEGKKKHTILDLNYAELQQRLINEEETSVMVMEQDFDIDDNELTAPLTIDQKLSILPTPKKENPLYQNYDQNQDQGLKTLKSEPPTPYSFNSYVQSKEEEDSTRIREVTPTINQAQYQSPLQQSQIKPLLPPKKPIPLKPERLKSQPSSVESNDDFDDFNDFNEKTDYQAPPIHQPSIPTPKTTVPYAPYAYVPPSIQLNQPQPNPPNQMSSFYPLGNPDQVNSVQYSSASNFPAGSDQDDTSFPKKRSFSDILKNPIKK